MTKYILAGGQDRQHPEYLTQLARIIQAEVESPKILSCWFSNPDTVSIEKFPVYEEYFSKFFQSGLEFTKAEKSTFVEQVEAADVIYFHGGQTSLLLSAMKKYNGVRELFADKIVVGSSAGANYIAKLAYSPSIKQVVDGAGLIDVVCIVHYGSKGFAGLSFDASDWAGIVETIKKSSGDLPVLLLPEGTFAVFDV